MQDMTPVAPVSPPPWAASTPVQYPNLKTLQKAAQSGDAQAQFQLGAMYADGQGGVSQDYAKALQWFKKSAAQGHAAWQYSLGRMHIEGLGGVPRDGAGDKAIPLFKSAADQGYADAQFVMGVMYAQGLGVQQNRALAQQWLQKAAAQGHSKAQAILSGGQF